MTFNRDNATSRNTTLGIPARNTNSSAWIVGMFVLAAIVIGVVVYETRGTHESVAPTATHEMTTTPPPVNPPPSPEPVKP